MAPLGKMQEMLSCFLTSEWRFIAMCADSRNGALHDGVVSNYQTKKASSTEFDNALSLSRCMEGLHVKKKTGFSLEALLGLCVNSTRTNSAMRASF